MHIGDELWFTARQHLQMLVHFLPLKPESSSVFGSESFRALLLLITGVFGYFLCEESNRFCLDYAFGGFIFCV